MFGPLSKKFFLGGGVGFWKNFFKNSRMRVCFSTFWATLIFGLTPDLAWRMFRLKRKFKIFFPQKILFLNIFPLLQKASDFFKSFFFSPNCFLKNKKFKLYCILFTDESACTPKIISITHKFKRCVTLPSRILVFQYKWYQWFIRHSKQISWWNLKKKFNWKDDSASKEQG